MRTLLAASIAQQRAALARGDVSARELVALHLEQIERVNPHLNAVVALDAESALAAAERVDRARARGHAAGALAGIPMTLKDGLDTRGLVTTGGTLGRRAWIPERDATAAARLKRAGAVLLGKTNTPELTLYYDTDNLVHGRTLNPCDTARSPGGSSGGAAAIVAACGATFDLGSDTGGSIRLPAHFCGLAGLKPTSGRVPGAGFVIPPGSPVSELTQLGPIARHVRDLFPVLRAVAGPDDGDSRVPPVPLRDPARVRPERLRIGWYADNGIVPVSPAVRRVVEHAAAQLVSRCARVEPALPPGLADTAAAYARIFGIDGGAWVRRLLTAYGTERPFPRLRWAQGLPDEPASALTELHATIEARRAALLAFMRRYDALLCPVHTDAALPSDALMDPDRRVGFTYAQVYNLAGWPAGVVRAGASDEGLPIGVQVVARPWREDVVLAVMEVIETACGGWQAPALAEIPSGGEHDG